MFSATISISCERKCICFFHRRRTAHRMAPWSALWGNKLTAVLSQGVVHQLGKMIPHSLKYKNRRKDLSFFYFFTHFGVFFFWWFHKNCWCWFIRNDSSWTSYKRVMFLSISVGTLNRTRYNRLYTSKAKLDRLFFILWAVAGSGEGMNPWQDTRSYAMKSRS